MPRTFAATTGTPSAIASRTASPCPSSVDAERNAPQRIGVGVIGDRTDQLQEQIRPALADAGERLDERDLVLARLDAADEPDDRPDLGVDARLVHALQQIDAPWHVAQAPASNTEPR